MKTLILVLTIKLLVIFPMAQQPDSAERSKSARANAVKAKVSVKPAKSRSSISGGLLYRIPLSI